MVADWGGYRRPSFRPLDGAPVASLRCHTLRPGEVSISRSPLSC